MIDVETYLISWGTCSSLLYVALIKRSDQEQLGEDKLIYFSLHFQYQSSLREVGAGTHAVNLGQKPWRKVA